MPELNEADLKEILSFGNVCGALTASGFGAIDACPDYDTVVKILKS